MTARLRRLLVPGASFAVLVVGAPAATGAQVSRHVLSNGMTVIVRESRAARVVAVSLQVDAATHPETEETAGITNFLHHAMLRGTSRRPASQVAEAADELGGALEASGDADHGEIRGHALARHWDALLTLIADVALDPALPGTEVEVQRRLILSQIQNREDNPFPLALDTLLRGLYGSHPYAWPALGRRGSIAGITRESLIAHHRALYRPDRLVLAVSGDIERERVVPLVERRFGALRRPTGGGNAAAVAAPPILAADRRVIERAAHQAQVLVGFLGPPLRDPDHAATKVLAALLGGGLSSRLFLEIRERRGLAYSVGLLSPARPGPGYLVAHVRTSRATAETAERELHRQLEIITGEPPSEEEVERAKAYVLGAHVMDRRTNARHAWYLAFYELIGAGWEFPDRSAAAVSRVTAADVVAAARRYLTRSRTVVLLPPR